VCVRFRAMRRQCGRVVRDVEGSRRPRREEVARPAATKEAARDERRRRRATKRLQCQNSRGCAKGAGGVVRFGSQIGSGDRECERELAPTLSRDRERLSPLSWGTRTKESEG
jgi:hypothetical protein